MKIKSLITLFGLLLMSVPLQAQDNESSSDDEAEVQEVKYVTDKLRLSLYKNASDKSGTLKLLVSGDKLGVLEKQGPYSKVKTADGETGWVKNGFLVSDPTASFQLVEEQNKNEILAKQIEQYSDTQKMVDDYEATISQIGDDFATATQELETVRKELDEQKELNVDLQAQIEASQQGKFSLSDLGVLFKQFWYLAIGSMIILFLGGFIVGRELVEAQVRRRFQGVKVW